MIQNLLKWRHVTTHYSIPQGDLWSSWKQDLEIGQVSFSLPILEISQSHNHNQFSTMNTKIDVGQHPPHFVLLALCSSVGYVWLLDYVTPELN